MWEREYGLPDLFFATAKIAGVIAASGMTPFRLAPDEVVPYFAAGREDAGMSVDDQLAILRSARARVTNHGL